MSGVDLDCDLDVPFQGIWRNDGQGASWTVLPLAAGDDVLAASDVDADGDVDLLTRRDDPGGAVLTLQRNQGSLSFSPLDFVAGAASDAFGTARFADLDDDGDADVVGAGGTGTIAAHVVENQAGAFVASAPRLAPHAFSGSVYASDVDGDGRTDVVCERRDATVGGATWIQVQRRVTALQYEPPRHWIVLGIGVFGDIDEDGDDDVFDSRVVRGRAFEGPSFGRVRQYGEGIAGAGGLAPLIGASGPVRPNSSTASFRVRRARAAAPALLFVGFAEADLPNVIPGGSFFVQPPLTQVSFVIPGPPGAPCVGGFAVNLGPFVASLSGSSLFQPLVVVDPAASSGYATSNGLEITFGF